ncbi:MAG TPA: hypothetical protein VED40_04655 [Azospirillaceae bacterium]|nr:hypothetical protein [Azospirillaceae bacterium]
MSASPAPGTDTAPILQRDHKVIRGKILYTSKKPERLDQERGREWFHITLHGDGSRVMQAHCEIDDRPSVMRDITYAVDPDWKPLDCHVRLTVGDRFMGSGWFRFAPTFAECETHTRLEGRVSQRMELAAPLRSFQHHAIAADSWHFRLFDLSRPDEIQTVDPVLLSSPDHRGATGPMLFSVGMSMKHVGRERVHVGAGSFDALHFQVVSAPGLPQAHPPYDVWCTDDGHFTLLKAAVGGYMQTYYELVELEGGF